MLRKLAPMAVGMVVLAGSVAAEPVRPLLTKENRFPDVGHAEVGFRYSFVEEVDTIEEFKISDTNVNSYIPFVRYRPAEPITLIAKFPYAQTDADSGDDESGLGDIRLGFDLLAYEDIFHYPWIIPHAEAVLDTGDDGIGRGESSLLFGLAIGSTAWETTHFIADARYEIFEDSENVFSLAFSIVWDLSDRFGIFAEAAITNEEIVEDQELPVLFLGGLSYDATDRLHFVARGGGGKNSRQEVVVNFEATFDL